MPDSKRVMVTGAAGFVGRALCRRLLADGFSVVAIVRQPVDFPDFSDADFVQVAIGDMAEFEGWHRLLQRGDLVFHLAARAHVMHDDANQAGALYRSVNVGPTVRLAQAAAECRIRRLVFLSSVKVNGERTDGSPFREMDTPLPQDAYGISKWEAEIGLAHVASETGLDYVVIRTPLVYGPGVKANFLRLISWVDQGLPLPFASIQNLRSLIYLENLVDALLASGGSPLVTGRTYLVSDGKDVSTPDLINAIAASLHKPARLFHCPVLVLRGVAKAFGRYQEADRLAGSLQVDISSIRNELGWQPPFTLEQGLAETARWYMNEKTV